MLKKFKIFKNFQCFLIDKISENTYYLRLKFHLFLASIILNSPCFLWFIKNIKLLNFDLLPLKQKNRKFGIGKPEKREKGLSSNDGNVFLFFILS